MGLGMKSQDEMKRRDEANRYFRTPTVLLKKFARRHGGTRARVTGRVRMGVDAGAKAGEDTESKRRRIFRNRIFDNVLVSVCLLVTRCRDKMIG
jgi:hypothetical protein